MPRYPIWPHRLVFKFAYGRWCTSFVLFGTIFFLFYPSGAMVSIREEAAPLFFCFIIAYIIPASYYVNAHTLAAFDSLKPSLDLGRAELADIRDSLKGVTAQAQVRRFLFGMLAGCGHDYLLLTADGGLMQ